MKTRLDLEKPDGSTLEADVVVFEDEGERFVAECVDLPGCISEGRTADEALENLKDAARGYLASLERHREPIPPPSTPEPGCKDEVEESTQTTCLDCGTELRPEDPACPTCGSRNRLVTASEHVRMLEMTTLKQKASGFRDFKVKQKLREKLAGDSGRPAGEFLVLDKDKNLKCHVVAEKGESCRWRLVHLEICPLDPSDPITSVPAEGSLPFEVDVCTEKHVVLRGTQPPHPRLTVPREVPSVGCARLLFACASLPPWAFGRLLLSVQPT